MLIVSEKKLSFKTIVSDASFEHDDIGKISGYRIMVPIAWLRRVQLVVLNIFMFK